jgi:hypothetical protein
MSRMGVAVVGVLLGIASMSFAQEPIESYSLGGPVDPYSGPAPPGMRFGDGGHVVSVQTGDAETPNAVGGCPMCRFGIHGAPCDPAWRGPCIEWKLVGWYSSWHDKDHGCDGRGHGCGHGCRSCCD